MNFVLDASVAVAWAFEDEREPYATAVLESLRVSEALAPALWPLEVANALLTAERRQRISATDATRFVRILLTLPVVVAPVERTRVLDAVRHRARAHGLSAYDAAYLDAAVEHGVPLATLDRSLRAAAEAEGVGAFEP